MYKLLFLLAFFLAQTAPAQTVIDLKRGGTVRSKTTTDYALEQQGVMERQHKDSLAYTDCIRRGLNALYADSLSQADAWLTRALKLRPEAPGNYVLQRTLGTVALAQGRARKAYDLLTEVLRNHPDDTPSRAARAKAALMLNMALEAVSDAEVAMAAADVAPADALEMRYVHAAARYSQRLYTEALADLEQLLQRQPSHHGAALLEALTLEKLQRPKQALEKLNAYLKDVPEDAEALLARAELYLTLGRKEEAKRDFVAATKLGVPMGRVQEGINRCR